MNLGKKLAEGFAVDTEIEDVATGPIPVVTETVEVTVEEPAEPVTA